MIHSYRKTPQGGGNYIYTVGLISRHQFEPLADFDAQWKAAIYTSFLNGGDTPSAALLEEATR